MDRTRHKDLIKEIRGCGAKVQPISDGDVQAAIAVSYTHLTLPTIAGS